MRCRERSNGCKCVGCGGCWYRVVSVDNLCFCVYDFFLVGVESERGSG